MDEDERRGERGQRGERGLSAEDAKVGTRAFAFNIFVGVFTVIVSLLIGFILTEISRLNGVIAERGERITRIEGRNDRQDDEIKRLAEADAAAAAERKEIFDYLTGKRK